MLGTPGIIVAAALGPPMVYAALILLLDRRRPRPWTALGLAVLWGVVAAFASAPLNDLLLDHLTTTTTAERARALAATAGAPIVEEILKGLGPLVLVLVRPGLLRNARDGIVCGALVGIGFDLAENLEYLTLAAVQGGMGGLARGIWVRGILGGVKHAVFTATTGAALGSARDASGWRGRLFIPLLGLSAAVAQHALWNAVASTAITRALCGAPTPEAACRATPSDIALFVSIPLIVILCVGPGVLALTAVARATSGRRLGAGTAAALAALAAAAWPASARADGGTIELVQTAGPFIVTVFSAPAPLRVGPVDLSVLVQDRVAGTPLLDAQVALEATAPGEESRPPMRRDATRAEAVNKLLYAAPVTIDTPGVWPLRISVRRGEDSADVRGELRVLPARSGLGRLWPYLALPPAAVALYAVHGWLARRRRLPASSAGPHERHAG